MQNFYIFVTHHWALCYALAIVLSCLALIEWLRLKRNKQGIGLAAAVLLINQQQAVVVDTRAASLFQAGHIINALSVPGLVGQTFETILTKHASKPIILVCESGRDSQALAMKHLARQGMHYLIGGMQAWRAANMPLVRDAN